MESISRGISCEMKKLYTSLSIADQLFDQTVHVVVYEQLMKAYFVSELPEIVIKK